MGNHSEDYCDKKCKNVGDSLLYSQLPESQILLELDEAYVLKSADEGSGGDDHQDLE